MLRRVGGRPVLQCLDRAAQRRRTRSRRQRRIVSGVTSSRIPSWRTFGITLSRVASSAWSAQFRFGRRGCCRCRTASWWRRIKISAVFHVSSRWDSRSHQNTRAVKKKANRRHMIGDHHGRAAGRATLLVTTVDGILGTYRSLRAKKQRKGLPQDEPSPRSSRPALELAAHAAPLHGAAPLKPLPEPADLEQRRVRRQARVGGLINEYRMVAWRG